MRFTSSRVLQIANAACLALLLSSMASADDAKNKVVVLDLQRAVMSTTQAREQIKTLEADKEYAETRKKAEGIQKDMEKKMADAKKEGPTWTPEQQANYRKDMEFMQKDLELNGQKLQAAEQALLRQVMKDMQPKLKQVVDELVKSEKISILVRAEAAIFAVPDADITDEVTAKLNALK